MCTLSLYAELPYNRYKEFLVLKYGRINSLKIPVLSETINFLCISQVLNSENIYAHHSISVKSND